MTSIDNTLRRLVEDAYREREECPAPEMFLADSGIPDETRARIERHAESCPACAAERELARAFDTAPRDVDADDLDYVVDRLEGRPVWQDGGGTRVVAARFPRPRRWHFAVPLAAAAGLVLAAGLGLQMFDSGAPMLPDPGAARVMRGSTIEPIAPRGELDAMPAAFAWVGVEGAARYEVRLLAVDDTVLWSHATGEPRALVPPNLADRMHRAVRYRWSVDAFGANGARLAWSKAIDFRVKPGRSEE